MSSSRDNPVQGISDGIALARAFFFLRSGFSRLRPGRIGDIWIRRSDNFVFVEIPESFEMTISQSIDPRLFDYFIDPFVSTGALTEEQRRDVHKAIVLNAGKRIRLWDWIPDFFKVSSLSEENFSESDYQKVDVV